MRAKAARTAPVETTIMLASELALVVMTAVALTVTEEELLRVLDELEPETLELMELEALLDLEELLEEDEEEDEAVVDEEATTVWLGLKVSAATGRAKVMHEAASTMKGPAA